MACHILSASENSFERTIVYQIMQENRTTETFKRKKEWTTKAPCMLREIFVSCIAQLPDKPQSTGGGFITSGCIVPPSTLSDPLLAYDISNLAVETRKIIYKYDCNCVPFYENQLGVLQQCDNFADLWGFQSLQNHPVIHLHYAFLLQTLDPR